MKNKIYQMLKRFNELNSTTYLSASDKANKYGQYNRSMNLTKFVYQEFIGKEINNMKIINILYGGSDKKTLLIQLKDNSIVYSINDDILLHNVSVYNRKDAVILSKIILKANPNSKYKNVNNIKIENY